MDDRRIKLPNPLLPEQHKRRKLGYAAERENYGKNSDILFCKLHTTEGGRQHNTPKKGQAIMYVEKDSIDHSVSPTFPKIT